MNKTSSNPGALRTLLLLHKSMLVGQLIFATVAFYLVYSNQFATSLKHLDRPLQLIAIAFSAAAVYGGNFLFKKKLAEARTAITGAKEKMAIYRQACIIQWAMIEGASLFSIICFLLTRNYAFLVLAAVLMLLFAMMAPSKLKITIQLQISEAEIEAL